MMDNYMNIFTWLTFAGPLISTFDVILCGIFFVVIMFSVFNQLTDVHVTYISNELFCY